MKRIILITMMMISLSWNLAVANDTQPINDEGYVIVKVVESRGTNRVIYIYRGESNVEEISLDRWEKKHIKSNLITIAKTLNKIKSDGYILISSNASGGGDNETMVQTYVFQKE